MRAFAAISFALALCAAPAFAAPRGHVAAAKKAERRGEWLKALRQWKAAYAKDANPEYLIAIGDAHSHLGNRAEARKSYEAYLGDPLALPANIGKVKARISQLAALPAATPPVLPLPGLAPPAAPAVAEKSKEAVPPLPLPAQNASMGGQPVQPRLPARAETAAPVESDPVPTPAAKDSAKPPAKLTVVVAAAADRQAPIAAVSPAPLATQQRTESSRVQRTMAYVSAAVAVAAFGGGAVAYRQADSAHGELTRGIHSAAETQRLLEDERRYRTLSLVGFAGGLVVAGIATALFAF